ncbi:DUF6907 domain-containing protein [Kitasatospora sp. NBC_01302]|uniref:DUF6907 domain-containing protein n=1 Tax=Kitasatospora sp. NBC_01302 TaxID=2903575 RepID=UPI002E0D796C|nr:hypothetical protein OG294_27875 [Kitasatospora sp. NBC_01302]
MSRVSKVRLANGQSIELPEPDWCTGAHEPGMELVDIFHEGPEAALTVETVLGSVRVLEAALTAYPFASTGAGRVPVVTVALDGGYVSFDPQGLRRLATGLAGHALRLRGLAAQLDRVRAEAGR